MVEPVVEYKTNLPEEKLPYYRLTVYMDENFMDSNLMFWFKWVESLGIPVAVAMGVGPSSHGKLAVWVWGKEYNEYLDMENIETMGRIVMEYNWPVDLDEHNEKLYTTRVKVEQLNLFG